MAEKIGSQLRQNNAGDNEVPVVRPVTSRQGHGIFCHVENFDECVGPTRIRNPYPNYVYSKDLTKTDYRLTKKSRYDLWLDLLREELAQNRLLDVIDDSVEMKETFSNEEIEERKRTVRFIIINKIDELYHNTVINIKEPKDILKTIMKQKRAEQNVGSAALRQIINTIKYRKEVESVHDFNLKFDELVRRHSMIASGMNDDEIKDAYQNSMKTAFPNLETIVLSRGNLAYDELKLITATLEASDNERRDGNAVTEAAMYVRGKKNWFKKKNTV